MRPNPLQQSSAEYSHSQLFERLSLDISDEQYLSQIDRALGLVFDAHDPEDNRPSSRDVSLILKHLGVDTETLIATLLSDPRVRDSLDILTIEIQFNAVIANLVSHVNWLNTFKEFNDSSDYPPAKADSLHRMLLATVDDVRAVIIKLAFRVQRLRRLKFESLKVQHYIAQETFDVYVPLANRLGLSSLKWELEDLAFRYSEPLVYASLARSMADKRSDRENYIASFVSNLQTLIEATRIKTKIYGRPKHLFSIWKKMQKKNLELHELADLLAVRIIVPNLSDCYVVLQLVHNKWQHLAHEFDDYIANPKANGYQSIHTAIFGPQNRVVEIQIRSQEMHDFAEHGIAAHWRYKEGSEQDRALLKSIETLRRLLDNRIDDNTLLEEFKTEFFSDRVLVLTPQKEVLDLPKGSTVLDFAYSIHTQIGHRCSGAMVNGQRVPLSYPLRSGECVEILTDKDSTPHLDWLNQSKRYVHTVRAKSSIRQWFRSYFKNDENNLMVFSRTLQGVGELEVKRSACCNPQLGDKIIGELLAHKAISIHRFDCKKIQFETNARDNNLIELNWGEETSRETVSIHIDAFDRQGLLLDITALLNQSQFNVLKAHTETDIVDQSVAMQLTIEINSLDQLEMLLKQIKHIANVLNAVQITTQ